MAADSSKLSNTEPASSAAAADRLPGHISQNIDSIVAFYKREEQKATESQRRLAYVVRIMGRPLYLLSVMFVAALWLLFNWLAPRFGWQQLDPPPFFWLQGMLGLGAFLTTTVVLIAQHRQAQFEAQRLNLSLQMNLLTEQKTTKLIHLIEELRRDLPMVKDRHDAVATALQTPTDPAQLLQAFEEQREGSDALNKKPG